MQSFIDVKMKSEIFIKLVTEHSLIYFWHTAHSPTLIIIVKHAP